MPKKKRGSTSLSFMADADQVARIDDRGADRSMRDVILR